MSVGGRGNSSRGNTLRRGHAPLPNLSIAGKRETKCESTGTKGTRRAGKRERGGRGKYGRNQGRETGRQLFIEQQGIFSSGLNDDGRHKRVKSSISNELCTTSLGQVKKVDQEDAKKESDINSITYESEWLSDEEADNEELQELLRDGFLSDLKPGKVIPLVLPETEQEQFQQLIKKEKGVENDCRSMDMNFLLPTKKKRKDNQHLKPECEFEEDVKKLQLKELETVNTASDPTATSSRRAATIMRKIQEDEDGSILMLQLPSTLSAIKNSASQEDTLGGPKSEDNTCPTIKHCLDGFANGSKIGKLRIRKGGRMELSFCGMPLDVACGVATRYNESVLLIDPESQTTTSTIKSECGDEQSPCRGYILGTIVDSFICSHNLPEALDDKREEQQLDRRKYCEIKNQQDEKEDLEMKDLLLELSSIEKKEESWSKWTLEYSDSLTCDDS